MVIVDSSCLIDLHKVHLLPCCLALPWQFIVPYPVRHEELLDFTEQDWVMMETRGLQTLELAPDQVTKVAERKQQHRRLSLIDCACLVLAQCFSANILLTGDAGLRHVATHHKLCVHGALWIVDQLKEHKICSCSRLIQALQFWEQDPTVFLPSQEIQKRLRQLI